MRILVEGHEYEPELVKDLLPVGGKYPFEKKDKPVMVDYVGYFFNTSLKDCVFILPKVLLEGETREEEKVFGKYKPEDIIDFGKQGGKPLNEEERRSIYNFAVWIYRAINVYNDSDPGNKIVDKQSVTKATRGFRHKTESYLDILLALRQFNQDNQNFFFFVLRNLHSGYNKINWTRTISKSTAIIQDNRPIYLNPVNRKRQINFDEELLVIFFSILNYINISYGFHVPINCNFDLIKGKQFDTYIEKGLGRTRLLQIKYKYFSDKALELWELCYTFFENAHQVSLRASQMEYLVARNFNIVFEAMIDELIGDKEMEKMKEQEDGKIVDHIYKYKGLTIEDEDKEIYYVGDSKYYKIGNKVVGKALYKQFTYARNITQWHLDLFRSDAEKDKEARKRYGNIKLRDNLTEGYNIIPNFFISAMMNKKEGSNEMSFDYSNDELTPEEWDKEKHMLTHFPNRLFDRDTMLVFHYNMNFLYVLVLYARNNYLQKEGWRDRVRDEFRSKIQAELNREFSFHAMKAKPGNSAEIYINDNFHKVLGKIFVPFDYDKDNYHNNIFSLALDKGDKYEDENKRLLVELKQHFYVKPCLLGESARDKFKDIPETIYLEVEIGELALYVTKVNKEAHYNIVEKIREKGKFGIALQNNGAVLRIVEGLKKAKYLIIHDKSRLYTVFRMSSEDPAIVPASSATDIATSKKDADMFLVYDIEKEPCQLSDKLEFSTITKSSDNYSPHLLTIGSLIAHDETAQR